MLPAGSILQSLTAEAECTSCTVGNVPSGEQGALVIGFQLWTYNPVTAIETPTGITCQVPLDDAFAIPHTGTCTAAGPVAVPAGEDGFVRVDNDFVTGAEDLGNFKVRWTIGL